MAPLTTYHPFKALYAIFAVALETVRFPLWLLSYIPSSGRPHKKWSFRQAMGMRIVKAFLQHTSTVQVQTPLSLKPGREGKRFVVMDKAAAEMYMGPMDDGEIRPQKLGATWTKQPPSEGEVKNEDLDIILHFHGGAYVIGDGRDHDTGFAAHTLLKHARATHILTPQYRLSSNPGGRFPAALQDALTSYLYLLKTRSIPASRITLSGDSAGANLALALLRYISEFGSQLSIPWPGAVLLWSPWVNVFAGLDHTSIERSPNYSTDYLGGGFGSWGAQTFTGFGKVDAKSPYVSPLGNAFHCESPMWVQTGAQEVLCRDDEDIAAQFREKGTKVELVVKENCPHDIILVGGILGFEREARECAKIAGEFVRANRLE